MGGRKRFSPLLRIDMASHIPGLRRAGWATIGLGYLALAAVVLSTIADTPFLATWLAVLTGAIFLTTLLLVCLTRWATRDDLRDKQFSLATLLLATTLLAVFLALVRWLVLRNPDFPRGDVLFLMFAGLCLAMLACALPGALFIADAAIWLAVWILRRRAGRRTRPTADLDSSKPPAI